MRFVKFISGLLLFAVTLSSAEKQITTIAAAKNPYGIAIGPDGALYVSEIGNHRVSRLDLKTKDLSIVAADQSEPYEVAFDKSGNLFFVDMPSHIVRRIDAKTKVLTTIAGTGVAGFSGDGGPATQAQFRQPHSIAFDPSGRLLICDIGNHRIRRMDLATGLVETYAGTGERKPTPDGAAVSGVPLNGPRAIAFDRAGNLFLVLREGNAVYRVDAKDARIHHIAGTGEKGYSGDGADAKLAKLSGPKAISCAPDGSVYIADTESHTIRRIDKNGIISTVAGTGERGDGPDGDPLKCKLARPHGIYVDQRGVVYIGDSESNKVRILK